MVSWKQETLSWIRNGRDSFEPSKYIGVSRIRDYRLPITYMAKVSAVWKSLKSFSRTFSGALLPDGYNVYKLFDWDWERIARYGCMLMWGVSLWMLCTQIPVRLKSFTHFGALLGRIELPDSFSFQVGTCIREATLFYTCFIWIVAAS